MTTEKRKRSNYTEDFKRDAVALVTEQGYKISEAARSLDVGANLIGRWRRQFEEEASGVRLSGESYCQIWCMPRKSSGDLVGLFDLFSVNKCHAFNDLCQVFEAA